MTMTDEGKKTTTPSLTIACPMVDDSLKQTFSINGTSDLGQRPTLTVTCQVYHPSGNPPLQCKTVSGSGAWCFQYTNLPVTPPGRVASAIVTLQSDTGVLLDNKTVSRFTISASATKDCGACP
jgi:hypothetical protein